MHPLLKRQLRKHGIDGSALPVAAEAFRAFLERVASTYAQADQDRYMLERSLEACSQEMAQLHSELRAASEAEIRKTNERLGASLALAKAVQESVADGILVVAGEADVLVMNGRFRAMWQIPPEIGSGTDQDQLAAHMGSMLVDPTALRNAVQTSRENRDTTFRSELVLRDGRTLERFSAPVRSTAPTVHARVVCFRDVTDERRLNAQRVLVAERMASVGQLVASVAHEINNPLAYAGGNLALVLESVQGEAAPMSRSDMVEALADAKLGIDRIGVIVGDLRMLSRVDAETREPVDVRAVLESALSMANNQIRHRARVERLFHAVPPVAADDVRLSQVFLNLLVNAAQAIPAGRTNENTVTVRMSADAGRVRVEIEDTGAGIAPEHLERIFDPFFTTKPIGSGTGLGLSICRGIVDGLGGSLTARSVVGRGTTFTVDLPALGVEAQKIDEAEAPKETSPRRSILVVDDDPHVRRWLERVLHTDDVVSAGSVDAAIRLLGTRTFDVVICDVMMPDRTGLDMHAFVAETHPSLLSRMIFLSGGAFTPTLEAFFDKVQNVCLRKPVGAAELRSAIGAVTACVLERGHASASARSAQRSSWSSIPTLSRRRDGGRCS